MKRAGDVTWHLRKVGSLLILLYHYSHNQPYGDTIILIFQMKKQNYKLSVPDHIVNCGARIQIKVYLTAKLIVETS